MILWKIEPVAQRGDPRWLDHPVWEEVVVRAPTAAEARVLAAGLERREQPEGRSLGNESQSFSSGFEDEKLYGVRRIDPVGKEREGDPEEGPPEVVSARKAPNSPSDLSRAPARPT